MIKCSNKLVTQKRDVIMSDTQKTYKTFTFTNQKDLRSMSNRMRFTTELSAVASYSEYISRRQYTNREKNTCSTNSKVLENGNFDPRPRLGPIRCRL